MQHELFYQASATAPLVVSYGMGVDSTALLIGFAERGIRPDAILFADTGSEKPDTYAYGRDIMPAWLRSVGFPQIQTVTYKAKRFKNWPPYHSLEENCLTNFTLPSIAFRRNKSCSQKWKISPQDKWVEAWAPAREAWLDGTPVRKTIGYDAGPGDIRRRKLAEKHEDPRFDYAYPLIDWGWDRAKCKAAIRGAGLPVPPKSACYFCPSTQPEELHEMPAHLLARIVVIEARAQDKLTTIEGLWTKSTKKKPGRMTDYIIQHRLLDPDLVAEIIAVTPTHAIYAGEIDDWQSFLSEKASGCSGCTACAAA